MAHERIYVTYPAGPARDASHDATAPGVTDRESGSAESPRPRGVFVQWLPDGGEVGIGTGLLDEPSDSLVGPGTREDLTVVWLDRATTNRLIRTLRRARNVACGADE